jgi:predicted nucleic acid-binding protein
MNAFVVDASVGFSWVYPSQASVETEQMLQEIEAGATVIVPSLWFLEVANALLAAERRKLITARERKTALERLSRLNLRIDEESAQAAFGKTSELAAKHGLSVYDATYLETALRHNLPLGSRDQVLCAAARKAGAKLHK